MCVCVYQTELNTEMINKTESYTHASHQYGNNGNSERLFFELQTLQMVTAAMKIRHLLLRRKAMTRLDSILKSRDITLKTKAHLVKAMVFPVCVDLRVGL